MPIDRELARRISELFEASLFSTASAAGPPVETTLTMERIRAMQAEVERSAPTPVRIVESEYLVDRVQFRFPRSKKRRIRKKWAKRERNFRTVPSDAIYCYNELRLPFDLGGSAGRALVVLVHPRKRAALDRALARRGRR